MLMIIFGAGASFDSSPDYLPENSLTRDTRAVRLPLANELFHERFAPELNRYKACLPIIPRIRHRPSDKLVEEVLEELQAEAQEYEQRHRQLAAIRYYLQDVIWTYEQRWAEVTQGVTNHKTLLDDVWRLTKPDETICLVTFNYDTLIEDALRDIGIEIGDMSDYIKSRRCKLIKLHGSWNWAHQIVTPVGPVEPKRRDDGYQLANEVIVNVPHLEIADEFHLVSSLPMLWISHRPLFPAIAIPVQRKLRYECPSDHVQALRNFLPQVDKILIIGWRATEKPFLEDLVKGLHQPVRIMAVCGSPQASVETLRTLEGAGIGIGSRLTASDGEGFSDFVRNREAEEFLKSN